MCISTITPMIFDGKGQALWVGRDRRFPTPVQIKAIIARDRHCTGCAAGPEQCGIHHIVPWEHGGLTDIDKFVWPVRIATTTSTITVTRSSEPLPASRSSTPTIQPEALDSIRRTGAPRTAHSCHTRSIMCG